VDELRELLGQAIDPPYPLCPGNPDPCRRCRPRQQFSTVVVASGAKKIDVNKQGLNKVKDDIVRNNLMGKSRVMGQKGWVDPQGRKGKVCQLI
jgi:hypothetical protein